MTFERISFQDGSIEYKIIGEMKSYTIGELKEHVDRDISEGKIVKFTLDFNDVFYIDSRGISLIVQLGKYNHNNGKKLEIKNASENIKRIIALAELMFVDFA